MKTILSVGQCDPDHNSLSMFLKKNFSCDIIRIDSTEEALIRLKEKSVDLVLVNRKLDIDYTDGTILIQKIKEDPILRSVPIMLISNFPESQEKAVQLGAVYGFGKLEYDLESTVQKIQSVLKSE